MNPQRLILPQKLLIKQTHWGAGAISLLLKEQ